MPSRARLHTIVSLLDGKIVRFFRRFLPLLAAKRLKFQRDSCNDLDGNVLSKNFRLGSRLAVLGIAERL
jgi:hypothetical protein